jgi:hypothetical protein
MGTGTETKVRCAVPIAAVMAGVVTRATKVGDFIVFKASFAEGVTHQGIHLKTEVIIGRGQLTLITERLQRGILLI